ncbi:MAG: hypothetical protein IPM23_08995 [Candidatus Melainabacteria bacterium]|nr:hypothetical protein [Candidatus Melainabacteria bacterium]
MAGLDSTAGDQGDGSSMQPVISINDLYTAQDIQRRPNISGDALPGEQGTLVPGDLSQGERPKSPAEQAFQGGVDVLGQRLKELGPQFEGAIKLSDDALVAADKNLTERMPELAPKMIEAQQELTTGAQVLADQYNKLPASDRNNADQALGELFAASDPAAKQAALAKLSAFPELQAAAKSYSDTMEKHAPVMKEINDLSTAMETAMSDSMMLRLRYAQILQVMGDEEGARKYSEQAQAMMMMFFGGGEAPPEEDQQDDRQLPEVQEADRNFMPHRDA